MYKVKIDITNFTRPSLLGIAIKLDMQIKDINFKIYYLDFQPLVHSAS